MRGLNKNVTEIFYANYLGKEEVKVDGLYTGEYEKTFDDIKGYKMCIMPSRASKRGAVNQVDVYEYGVGSEFDYEGTTTDMDCPINEYSKIWVFRPTTDDNDYYVGRIDRGLTTIRIGLKKVE